MSRSNADLLSLKHELATDPKVLGLVNDAAHDEPNSILLNAVVALPVKRRSLNTATLFNAIDPYEHQGLSDQQARWLAALLSLGQIDPFLDTNLIAGLNGLFGPDSVSRTAYTAQLTTAGNRIDQMYQAGLLEVGGQITTSEVANARSAV